MEASEVSRAVAAATRVEPRGYEHGGFEVTLWTYYEPVTPQAAAADYANALLRLHVGMRIIDVPAPHFTERVTDAPGHVAKHRCDPSDQLPNGQRALRDLLGALRSGPPWPTLDAVMRE